MNGVGDRHCFVRLAGVVLLLAVTWAGLYGVGRSSRQFAETRARWRVQSPREVFDVWRKAGVRGRTAVFFDRHVGVEMPPRDALQKVLSEPASSSDLVTDRNVLMMAIQAGYVRQAWHVVPDRAWSDVEEQLIRYPDTVYVDNRFFRVILQGTPILVTRSGDLPDLDEPALVFVNSSLQGEYEPGRLAAFMENPNVSDLIIVTEDRGRHDP